MDFMEDFVTFEIAKKLKEKGFREECLCHYINDGLIYNIESPIANNQLWFSHNKYDNIWHKDHVDAPTISQVLKWLRKKKYKFVCIEFFNHNIRFGYKLIRLDYVDNITENQGYETYEKAALAGIEYVLDNLI